MQLGPINVAPCLFTIFRISFSYSAPSLPISLKPAEYIIIALHPFCLQRIFTVDGHRLAGIASIAKSTCGNSLADLKL
jgi:hypothetical protein